MYENNYPAYNNANANQVMQYASTSSPYNSLINNTYKFEAIKNKFIVRNMIVKSIIWMCITFSIAPLNIFIGPVIGVIHELIYSAIVSNGIIKSYLKDDFNRIKTGRLIELTDAMCESLNLPTPEIYLSDCIKTDAFALKDQFRSALIFSSSLPLMATDEELKCVIANLLYQLQSPDYVALSNMLVHMKSMLDNLKIEYYQCRYGGSKVKVKVANWALKLDKNFIDKRMPEIREALCNYTRYQNADMFAVKATGNPLAMISIMNKISNMIHSKYWETKMEENKIDLNFDPSTLIGFTFNDYDNNHLLQRIQDLCTQLNIQPVTAELGK